MYSYIKGELVESGEDYIVIEANNIGYQIYVPGQVFSELPPCGSEIKVYTYLYVREDAMLLYGFLRKDDLNVFKLLLGVSGIGPKGALAILSVMTTDELRFAVLGEDEKAIAKAPGVGGKTAKRLILELKDKLKLEDMIERDEVSVDMRPANDDAQAEAIQALVALGYNSAESLRAVRSVNLPGASAEELLKEALKKMMF